MGCVLVWNQKLGDILSFLAEFALLLGLKRDRNEHDGSCQALKFYPAGSQHCSAARGKDRPRKSI